MLPGDYCPVNEEEIGEDSVRSAIGETELLRTAPPPYHSYAGIILLNGNSTEPGAI